MPLRQEGLEVRAPRSGPQPGLGVEEQEEALCGPDLAVLQEVLEPQQQWPEGQSWLPVWRHACLRIGVAGLTGCVRPSCSWR